MSAVSTPIPITEAKRRTIACGPVAGACSRRTNRVRSIFSRYIAAWKLCTTMTAEEVTTTLDLALQTSGLKQVKPADRPRLLSDNGSSSVASDLAKWLGARNIKHLCVARPIIR